MSSDRAMRTVSGLATSRGYAAGPVFLYRGDGNLAVPEYVIEPHREKDEVRRFRNACDSVRSDLKNLIEVLRSRTDRSDVRVFECHLMILEDPLLNDEIVRHIEKDRLNAEASVRRTVNGAREQFSRMNDPYFRERVRDLDDVERRLLHSLAGHKSNPLFNLTAPAIVVADDLTPSETV